MSSAENFIQCTYKPLNIYLSKQVDCGVKIILGSTKYNNSFENRKLSQLNNKICFSKKVKKKKKKKKKKKRKSTENDQKKKKKKKKKKQQKNVDKYYLFVKKNVVLI